MYFWAHKKNMMRIITLICLGFIAQMGFAQTNFNLDLVANVEVGDTGNDIWGYVDESTGIEYAIMGTVNNTRIFSLEDHSNPIELANIPGSSTTWRDIKTWQEYVYVVCDNCPDGLLIIDMSDPANISWGFKTQILLEETPPTFHTNSHNIFIDENGYAYLAGGNFVDGVIILDLNPDPMNPTVVGFEDFEYAHDVVVRGDTMWTSEIFIGELAAYDVSDKANPIYLGGTATSSNFTHNAWFSDDGNYIFTTDERANAYVDAYDVSDITDIKQLDIFQPAETAGNGVVPHNTHYIDGFLVTSWYTDGVVITDVNRPQNMVKVGGYDTFLGNDGGFGGCWGAYPWLPSGHVLASDRQTGLYVLSPTYQRACYLEGRVTNSMTGAAVFDAEILVVEDANLNASSDPAGRFATGRVEPGTINVQVSHPNYYPFETTAILENGEVTLVNAELLPREEVTVTITTKESFSENLIPNADIYIFRDNIEVFTGTGLTGDITTSVFLGDFKVIASAWGYRNSVSDISFDGSNIVLELDRGYEDTFVGDNNWTVSGNATLGIWERGKPLGTFDDGLAIAPEGDAPNDLANFAYVTGNADGNPWENDVDNGNTVITSDLMDLTWYSDPVIHFSTWFVNTAGNNTPNDELTVSITNGIETVVLYQTDESLAEWVETTNLPITGLEINDKMQLIVETADLPVAGHWVEGGFDAFLVTDGAISSNEDLDESIDFVYFPNPAQDVISIQWNEKDSKVRIFDFAGKLVRTEALEQGITTIQIADLDAGYYSLQIVTDNTLSSAKKLIKVD